jgi:hypothetical protein
MTKPVISLTTILPRLPAGARQWINGLPPYYRRTIEDILDRVGADNFVKRWQVHRQDQQDFEHDFGLA